MLTLTCAARRRERTAASATARSTFYSANYPDKYAEHSEGREGALPPLSTPTSSSKTLVPYAFHEAVPPNPWRQRTTLDALEARQRSGPHGVARFRPALEASREAVNSPSNHVKPLLEPFLCAEELAREAVADTWDLRYSRYLQWLRKGAVSALEAQEAHGGRRCPVEHRDTQLSTVATNSTGGNFTASELLAIDAVRKGGLGNLRAEMCSTGPKPLPLLPPCSLAAPPEVRDNVGQTVSSVDNASRQLSGANPNEVAVRLIFQESRAAAAIAGAGHTEAAASHAAPGDEIAALSAARSTRESLWWLPSVSWTHGVSGTLDSEIADLLVSGDWGAVGAEVGIDASAAVPCATAPASGAPLGSHDCVLDDGSKTPFGFINAENDDEEYENASHSSIEPPSAYDLATLLRDRMHRTVATFTASSEHTLDEPPNTAKTHTILGKVRLATKTWPHALLVNAVASEIPSRAAARGEASLAQQAPVASQNLARVLRQLLYEEEYERDTLRQLALQSAPARWYSTLLPSGKEGIRFRLLHPPPMTNDAAVRERLNAAMLHAAEAIAQPRRDAAAAEEDHYYSTTPVIGTRHGNKASDRAHRRSMELRAEREKAALFTAWSSLHAHLSAQLRLFTEETEQRRTLLGEFFSCAHPAPCACLDVDLEVLSMSAVPLEPTVKSACWFASVVFGRYQDVLQRELLKRYQAEYDHLYSLFKVEFFAIYSHQKIVADEARRFRQLIEYHQFCHLVAASREGAKQQPHSESPSEETALTLTPFPLSLTSFAPEPTALTEVAGSSVAAPRMHLGVLYRRDSRMRLLRLRRLCYCAAFDSPFAMYLVFVELLVITATEEELRGIMMASEVDQRAGLMSHMAAEAALVYLGDLEGRCRALIEAHWEEARNAMLAGPLVVLHAAHKAEVRAVQAAAHAKSCEEARQSFLETALTEKTAAGEVEMKSHRQLLHETRQRLLALMAACRSTAQSLAVLRQWLDRQQHVCLFNSEQRLRDRIAMLEETDARVRITAAAEASLRQTRFLGARRLSDEARTAREAAQRARDAEAAALLAQLRKQEGYAAEANKRLSANIRAGTANMLFAMAAALEDDFEAYLACLSSPS
ncbi:hypothetical protein LSCM1_03149 [Leishmania martiniquensis]|uniref:Uncharacterized protein n=1 Tax=Leishmania martiniquensis TaxID=1580590 RepID=A0A836GL38_9TRYP|nr:hypothetical protein LSCM1_03149 [Leishmania martiniquensis]